MPLFLTQGTTENNTVADGLAQYMRNHAGYQRSWLGPWEHVRGAETCKEDDSSTGCDDTNVGRLKMGRQGFYDEVVRFYDRFLKGAKPKPDPMHALQTNDGIWRAESSMAAQRLARAQQPVPHRHLHRRRRRLARPARRPPACGRSPSRCPTPRTWPARAARP